ncbi:hypothetical protein GGF46_005064 [Coemansia sp. RSA 552]|nr:hypothetical protein GGF46_005064 [Coemansia sp. RSA 552]
MTPSADVRSAAMHDARVNQARQMFSDKVLNFRDLGVSVIRVALGIHHSRAKAESIGPMPGVVFRSAEVGSVGEHDVKTLFSKYGIRTIIDLRSELEARASDILMRHYPASMQPTADQSMERLLKLRAEQLRNTIVEVAAHDYESTARPWERTGESRATWSRRNSLRYSRSIGNPRKDSLARALAHLYDPASDSDTLETQNVTIAKPYVPRAPLPVALPDESAQPSAGLPTSASSPSLKDLTEDDARGSPLISPAPQNQGIMQNAFEWGNETLLTLRSYWDNQWTDGTAKQKSDHPPTSPLPPIPEAKDSNPPVDASAALSPASAEASLHGAASAASEKNAESVDSFYHNSPSDENRYPTAYGLRPISHGEDVTPPQIVVDSADESGSGYDEQATASRQFHRATTEPSLPRLAQRHGQAEVQHKRSMTLDYNKRLRQRSPSQDDGASTSSMYQGGVRKPRVMNKFGGKRTRYRCNVIGDNYRKKCVWSHAPLSTKIKVVLRFVSLNKAEAIRTIGRDVLAPRGLAGSYEDYVDYCKEEFAAVLRIFADPCAYPVLFHCQHGKDRTGIVAMLLLGILGVDDQIIAEDYALSEKNLLPVRKRMEMLDMGAVGLPPSFCNSPAPVMLSLLHHIKTNYGSVRGYLRSAGLQEQEMDTIAWCLRGNFCGIVQAQSRRDDAHSVYLRPSAAHSDVFGRAPASAALEPSPLAKQRSAGDSDAE